MYFSWGNTNGEAPGSGYDFSEAAYSESAGASISSNLDLEHDAARLSLGGNWRMPTRAEFEELIANTTQQWTIKDGVKGVIVQSLTTGQSIFFPMVGYWRNQQIVNYGTSGLYLTSIFNNESYADNASIIDGSFNPTSRTFRYLGCSIRAVRDD